MGLNKLDSASNLELDSRDSFVPDPVKTLISEQELEFDKWLGYYRNIPELQAVIDRLATYVIYGGDDAKPEDEDITFEKKSDETKFNKFVGFGKDTPKQILFNLFRQGKIGGNSVAEIIRSRKKGVINLKPLNPETIKVFANKKGFLTHFTQRDLETNEEQKLALNQIFYLPWNRIADEIVGISTVEKLKKIIDYRHQAMEDLAEVYHRYVVPFWLFYSDTDDETEIATFKDKVTNYIKNRDFMVLPSDTIEKHERMAVPQFATLDPLNWIKHLERYFLLSEGVPELISGIGRETADASSRMIHLAWRVIVIYNQKIFEEAIFSQLGIKLKLPRPINIMAPEITEEKTKVVSKENNDGKKEINK